MESRLKPGVQPIAGPTPRQWELMGLLAEGLVNKDIADRMGLSYKSVKVYISLLFDRFPGMPRSRHAVVCFMARDHERRLAIRLDAWIEKYGDTLDTDARQRIQSVLADMVAPFLK